MKRDYLRMSIAGIAMEGRNTILTESQNTYSITIPEEIDVEPFTDNEFPPVSF